MTEARYAVRTSSESRKLVAALRRAGMNAQGDGPDGASLAGQTVDVWGEALDAAGVEALVVTATPEAVRL